jgi:cytochrome c2
VKSLRAICATAISLILLTACGPSEEDQRWAANTTGGNPARGKIAIQHYGCIACHTIDGLQSQALVGPPLTRMASRSYLAGNLTNDAANMIHWIQKPREIHKDTAMPDVGVTDTDARDIASYLYSYR